MMLAAASAPHVAHSLTYTLVTVAVVTFLVALAVLLVLFCAYLALKVWEQRRIIAHYQRQEKIERTSPQPSPQRGEGGAKKS